MSQKPGFLARRFQQIAVAVFHAEVGAAGSRPHARPIFGPDRAAVPSRARPGDACRAHRFRPHDDRRRRRPTRTTRPVDPTDPSLGSARARARNHRRGRRPDRAHRAGCPTRAARHVERTEFERSEGFRAAVGEGGRRLQRTQPRAHVDDGDDLGEATRLFAPVQRGSRQDRGSRPRLHPGAPVAGIADPGSRPHSQ